MIRIHYDYDRDHHHLHIAGHAGYAPAGSDIVCAGVSALSFALLGYLRQTNAAVEETACSRGALMLRCKGGGQADSAFSMALAGYQIIAETYPQHVEVDITPSEKGEEKERHHGTSQQYL